MEKPECIKTTTDARLFELLPTNRDTKKIAALTESMQRHGWKKAYPMYCVKNGNGKFRIVDGHHRFEVATRLGIPFKYVVDDEPMSVFEIDATTNKWDMEDHLTSQCRAGNVEYAKVRKYRDDTGIGILQAISMLRGQSAGSNNVGRMFKQGEFACKDTSIADTVRDIVLYMKKRGIGWAHHSKLVHALSRVALVPEFSPSTMKEKIKGFPYLIQKQPHLEGYMEMLETVYNFRARSRVPLKFLADEIARTRSIANR